MAIKTSGPLGIDADIANEIDHIDINDDGSIDLTSYYGKYVKVDVNDNLRITYTPAGQIPEGTISEPLPMGTSYYGVEVVYEFFFNSGTYLEQSLSQIILDAGWNSRSPVVINIGQNVLFWSSSITKEALTLDVEAPYVIINFGGVAMGKGGGGGTSYNYYSNTPLSLTTFFNGVRYTRVDGSEVRFCDGEDGGPAVKLTSNSTHILNMTGIGWIGGGGGGGGGMWDDGKGDVSFFDDAEPRYGGGGGGSGGGQGGAVARDAGYYAGGGAGGGPGEAGQGGGAIYSGTPGAGGLGPGLGGTQTDVRKRENRAGAGGGGGRTAIYPPLTSPGATGRAGRATAGHGGRHGEAGGNSYGIGGNTGPSVIYESENPPITYSGATSRIYGPKALATSYEITNYPG